MSKGRLEAFSDGVLAILITIMVLELGVPHEPTLAALLPLVPVGVWLGRMFVVRVSQQTFEAVILIFLVISALLLLAT